MSTQNQLRDYFAYVDDQQGAVDVAGLVENGAQPVQVMQPAPRRRTPVLAWAAVAAVVVGVLLLPILFFNGSESDVVTTLPITVPSTTVPDTTVPETEPAPIVEPSEATVEWELVTFDGVSGPLHGRVTAGDGRFLALQGALEARAPLAEGGWPIDADGDLRTILWTSVDGTTWEPHEVDVSMGNLPTVLGEIDGRVLIRQWQHEDGTMEWGSGRPSAHVVYWSDDLVTWTPIDFPELERQFIDGATGEAEMVEWSSQWLHDVVATSQAVLLVGGPFVVTDRDLSDFEVVDIPFGIDPDDVFPLVATDVVASSDRFYASVGAYQSGLSSVWSSADGIDWVEEMVDGEPIVGEAEITVAGDKVTVLTDGDRWYLSEAGGPFELVEGVSLQAGSEGFTRLLGGSDGFLLLGAFGFGEDEGIRSLGPWLSLDGRTWTWVPIEGATAEAFGAVMVGESILIPTGSWVVEFDGDGNIASEGWEPDGGWVLGRVIPAG